MITSSVMMEEVSEKLNILQENGEDTEHWYKRIAYSLVGGHMLATLYDFDDDVQSELQDSENTVSMQHVLNRGESLKAALGINDFDCTRLRELYINTGYMLHKKNRLTYPSKVIASDRDISFLRGIAPWDNSYISGIGLYSEDYGNSSISTEAMFGIGEQDINEWFSGIKKYLRWEHIGDMPHEIEFLNIDENTNIGYWINRAPRQGMTLYRTKSNGEKEYAIISISETIRRSKLPPWLAEKREYIRIATALRIMRNNSPSAKIILKTHTAEIYKDYLLPPTEQNFLDLYSWPIGDENPWRRIITISLYPTFKRILLRLGYKVNEG